MKPIKMLLLAMSLGGCAAQNAAYDDGKCKGYGATTGSPAYVQCRAQLDAARTQARAAGDAVPMPVTQPWHRY